MSRKKTEKLSGNRSRETTTFDNGAQKINTYHNGSFTKKLISSERRAPPKNKR